ncbi:hypothetical protein SK128_017244, partial [Halocaridina rubra]
MPAVPRFKTATCNEMINVVKTCLQFIRSLNVFTVTMNLCTVALTFQGALTTPR